MTNSLAATDVPIVHSAWMNYRPELLDAGVMIFELRAEPGEDRRLDLSDILTGSSASLHAKTFSIDGRRIFVGSFNFDPRSAMLNTEMGVIVESPRIAAALSEALDRWEMVFELTRGNGGYSTEPYASLFRRTLARVASWLPVEWVL